MKMLSSLQVHHLKHDEYIEYLKSIYHLPRTLDRFVCHCQDADIELILKVKK